ncbi:spermidine synthase [Psychromicrobium lacuslunae]|uniref:SAM-dependent methyltransferase n=1 Tax=Psychromicrobium lacuslunae TaxID=1618207 RepID=A0A0D4BY46_9MICC|nr:fused MFS/spermidine synthase [Psychromicrobium lacuslunae]AJT41239.1 SAM-dependent methyltransferase [Psychromicrobium lacuslunae]
MLKGLGQHAEIRADEFVPGAFVLSVGGADQSQVNLADPGNIFYEYLRRIANLLDLFRPAGEPIKVLHLGAGALTLARYLAVSRPGSEQFAVELERELLDFVLEQLPMPDGSKLRTLIGDARWALPELAADGPFDAIVLDIFSGPAAPEHIAHRDFYREAAALLAPEGMLLINIGDEPGLTLVRSQSRALRSLLPATILTGESSMFSSRYPGNLILAASKRESWPVSWTEGLLAAGPHPCRVVEGVELDEFS